jgi:hypothetical protein
MAVNFFGHVSSARDRGSGERGERVHVGSANQSCRKNGPELLWVDASWEQQRQLHRRETLPNKNFLSCAQNRHDESLIGAGISRTQNTATTMALTSGVSRTSATTGLFTGELESCTSLPIFPG